MYHTYLHSTYIHIIVPYIHTHFVLWWAMGFDAKKSFSRPASHCRLCAHRRNNARQSSPSFFQSGLLRNLGDRIQSNPKIDRKVVNLRTGVKTIYTSLETRAFGFL